MPIRSLIAALATIVALSVMPTPAAADPGIGFNLAIGFGHSALDGLNESTAERDLGLHRRVPLDRVLRKLRRQRYSGFRNITLRKGTYRIRCFKYGHRYKVTVDAYSGAIVRIRPI